MPAPPVSSPLPEVELVVELSAPPASPPLAEVELLVCRFLQRRILTPPGYARLHVPVLVLVGESSSQGV